MKLNHKVVELMFILKRKIIGTNHPLFAFCGCYCFSFYYFFKETKQAELYSSINEFVLTLVKRIVMTSSQLFTLAMFNLLRRLKHPEQPTECPTKKFNLQIF